MARSEVSAVLYVIIAFLLEPSWSAATGSVHPGTLDDFIERASVTKPGPADRSPGSVASSVSLSPLSPPLHAGDKLFFSFEDLPPAASSEPASAGILLKSPPRRASVGGQPSPASSRSRPPLARSRVDSHPPLVETSVSAEREARFTRLVSDFETIAIMNSHSRFDHFLQITNRPMDIAQWIVSSTTPEFQHFYHETVLNLTQSLISSQTRSSPYVDWRVLSLTNLHQALIASFPLRSYKTQYAITQQIRVTLRRISSNKPLEFMSRITAYVGKLNNSKIIRYDSMGNFMSRLVSCLIRAIDGQVVQPRFIEMGFSILDTITRIWSHIHTEVNAPFYIEVMSNHLAEHMESFELMAQWVTPTDSDDDVDRFFAATETACMQTFQRFFQIESVIDTVQRLSTRFRSLFRTVPVQIPGATHESLGSSSFLFALFYRMTIDQLDEYLLLISKYISDEVSISMTEILALNQFLSSELSAKTEREIPSKLAAVGTHDVTKLDKDTILHWLGRREERKCQSPIDYEIVGLLISGTVLVKSRNLPTKMIEDWKSMFRVLVRAVNVPSITEPDSFTVSVLIPARTAVYQMQNYQ